MKTITLNTGMKMPVIGLGTSRLLGQRCTETVLTALELGYRHLDTAQIYDNHAAIGSALNQTTIPRSEIFLTTKVPRSALAPDALRAKVEQYLQELQTEYLDLLLIHWPNSSIPLKDTLGAMESLRLAGKIKAIGVSNFTEHHLEDAAATGVTVSVNQIEIHPTFKQKTLVAYCQQNGIAVTAYAPFGREADMAIPLLLELAETYRVSVTQVMLNWIAKRGIVTIPKATSREHLADNLAALSWEMSEVDMARIDALPEGERLFNPDFNEFDY